MADESMSFIGYTFKKWFAENKDAIKDTIVKAAATTTAILGAIKVQNWWQAILVILATLAVSFLSRCAVDGIDYYFKP